MMVIRLVYKQIKLRKRQRENEEDMAYFNHRMKVGFGLKSSYKFKKQ